ncbi:hypothetical protein PoB_004761700 [Plakobranchus ocellatus]|uniref:Uncharacterized protein n=1 Tax=Plakobranchus ocellatus TaxID=259542 RepID=A0AAV4BP04_9GAST|nr:hypothetical protein PoB_004761700 [Plakobranchus ocellatus]
MEGLFLFLYIASPQQGDLRLSDPPSGQGGGGGARTRARRKKGREGQGRCCDGSVTVAWVRWVVDKEMRSTGQRDTGGYSDTD